MSEVTTAPEVVITPLESNPSASQPQAVAASEAPKVSPAQELRDIQSLLVGGIFPGNMAPAVIKAFNLLDKMSVEIENAK